ncbi:hypothetical protein EYF80_021375 [Liparis tanakae]|uniref:Uncharacterized protein n=1 Tax=Liparis tanakae TaxID=230148 RepID=A0A4Z2HTX7_9TELE|nr:hypothetical protein EYF80_021375 [Liparis tanakae]
MLDSSVDHSTEHAFEPPRGGFPPDRVKNPELKAEPLDDDTNWSGEVRMWMWVPGTRKAGTCSAIHWKWPQRPSAP